MNYCVCETKCYDKTSRLCTRCGLKDKPGAKHSVELICACGATETFVGADKNISCGMWRFERRGKDIFSNPIAVQPMCPQCDVKNRLKVMLTDADLTREQAVQAVHAAFDGFEKESKR